MKNLYKNRFISEGYPYLETKGVEFKKSTTKEKITSKGAQNFERGISRTLELLGKLIDLTKEPKSTVIIGCGPVPEMVRILINSGFDAVGVEPVVESVEAAREYLGCYDRVLKGSAESLPFESNTQKVIFMESVLEHVDSPILSLSEAYRVLEPGGILNIYTTNKIRFSLTGKNGEYRTKFYNWFPDIVKESYVFKHLHYDPKIANYSPRPAVHWYTFTDLCKLGRQVGFSKFYSRIDLIDEDETSQPLKRWLIKKAKYNPWIRALILVQFGNNIIMWKRS